MAKNTAKKIEVKRLSSCRRKETTSPDLVGQAGCLRQSRQRKAADLLSRSCFPKAKR